MRNEVSKSPDDASRSLEPPGPSELLAHRRFLEGLANHLALDPDAAADVVQETWLRAFRSPPRHRGNLRSWLGRIARNTLHRRLGRQERADEVERAALLPAEVETTDVIAERRELLERVSAEVDALGEPYKTVVLMRYFDERTPAEIAGKLARPVNTVNSQLQRGLERLRRRLDRAHDGGRSAWLAVLLGWKAEGARSEPVPAVGSASFVARGMIAVVATALGAMLWGVLVGLPDERPGRGVPVPRESAAAERTPSPAPGEQVLPTRSVGRTVLPVPPTAPPTEPLGWLDVEVVDASGAPLGDVEVRALRAIAETEWVGDRRLAPSSAMSTASDGTLSLPLGAEHRLSLQQLDAEQEYAALHVLRTGYVEPPLLCVSFPEDGRRELRVVLEGPALAARVIVRDAEDRPLRAEVSIGIAATIPRRPSADGVRRLAYPRRELTDEDGSCLHPSLGPGRYRLTVQAPGFVPHHGWIEGEDPSQGVERVVVLERGCTLSGRVSNEDGTPCPGAAVWAELGVGNERTKPGARTDEHGDFRLDGLASGSAWLFAQHPEERTLVAARAFQLPTGGAQEAWSPVLRPSPGLRLQVLSSAGEPRPAHVLYARLQHALGEPPWYRVLETDALGRASVFAHPAGRFTVDLYETKDEVYRGATPDESRRDLRPGAGVQRIRLSAEGLVRGVFSGRLRNGEGSASGGVALYLRGSGRSLFEQVAICDRDGAFRCEGLVPGSYELVARRPGTGSVPLGPLEIVAGEELRREYLLEPTSRITLDAPSSGECDDCTYELIEERVIGDTTVSWNVSRGNAPAPIVLELFPGPYRLRLLRGGRLLEERTLLVPQPKAGSGESQTAN